MSIILTQNQLYALTTAAQQAAQKASTSSTSAAAAASGSTQSANATSSSDTSATALSSLSSNYSEFLTLLTAQLQNQDPSSPMDSSQFTTELVQFSGVEQQVQTNSNLTQLLQLSQDQQLTQSSAMVGKQVVLTGSTVPLQAPNGAAISFDTALSEPVVVSISNGQGRDVKDVQLTSTAGQNTWTWNGTDNAGNALPSGPYNVAVVGADPTGATSAVPFTSEGTPTSVQKGASGLTVSFGATTLGYDDVQSVAQ